MTRPARRSSLVRAACLAIAAALLLWPAGRGAAQEAGDAAAIRGVISDQIAAFLRDDEAGAFAHASPGIRRMFRTPEIFGEMVRTGYPMIWRPASRSFGPLTAEGGRLRQTLVITDAAGRVHVADYHMIEVDGGWRIDGVELRRMPGAGA